MRVTLTDAGGTVYDLLPGVTSAEVVGLARCPGCRQAGPVLVAGGGRRREGHDTYRADARAVCCGHAMGVIRAVVSTVFGLEEDERVLHGRCRVY